MGKPEFIAQEMRHHANRPGVFRRILVTPPIQSFVGPQNVLEPIHCAEKINLLFQSSCHIFSTVERQGQHIHSSLADCIGKGSRLLESVRVPLIFFFIRTSRYEPATGWQRHVDCRFEVVVSIELFEKKR